MTTDQIELIIDEQRKLQSDAELIQWIIKLYGDELINANTEIIRLGKANDELFRIKQKVVIVNRDLLLQVHELELQLEDARRQLGNARDALRALADDDDKPRHVLD